MSLRCFWVMALTGMSPFAAMKILTAPSISRVRPLSHAPSLIFFFNASFAQTESGGLRVAENPHL